MSVLRVAVVGLGWAGRELWLPLLAGHTGFEVVAVVDPEPAARTAFAGTGATRTAARPAAPSPTDRVTRPPTSTPSRVPTRSGARPAVHATVDALTADAVDLAVVAVPNHLHAEVAATLLGRGVSVFLEKPVCLTRAEADVLAAAERDGDATLLAGSAAPHRADVTALARLLPDLGRVRHVDLSWVRARGVPRAGGWFTQRSKAGGGVLFDLGWHLLDTLASLLGPAGFTHVVGVTSDDFVNAGDWGAAWRRDRPGATTTGDVEDTARGFLVRDDGVSVALHTGWASHEARDVTRVRVVGSAGTADLRCTFGFSPNRDPHPVLTLTREGTATPVPVPEEPIGSEYRRQLDGLAALLTDPRHRGRAIGEARTTVRVIEDFYASAHARLPGVPHASAAGSRQRATADGAEPT